jgi:hypothetical protein
MVFPLYLAMTAAEMTANLSLPSRPAYLSCHFSPYGTGLSNLPNFLPENALIILDDQTPLDGHDPRRIREELENLLISASADALLLDLQRPGNPKVGELAAYLAETLPCPVAVSDVYGKDLSCPVFLSPVPPDVSPKNHLTPWKGREIWLEISLEGEVLTLTGNGCEITSLPYPDLDAQGFEDPKLHCHYRIEVKEKSASFTLWRTKKDLDTLLVEAEKTGISTIVGLYQELQ